MVVESCRTSVASDRPVPLVWATKCALTNVELFCACPVSLVYLCRCTYLGTGKDRHRAVPPPLAAWTQMDRPTVGDMRSRASLADLNSDSNLHSRKLYLILFAVRCRNYSELKQTNKIILEATLENHSSRN